MEAIPDSRKTSKLHSARWRLNNLYYITNKDGKKVKFRMNWAQELFYNSMWYLCVILKARQLGFSTFILIFILDRCLFNSNIRAGVIAHNKDDAKILFRDKIKFAYDNLPEWLKSAPGKIALKNDAGEMLFENNSSIRVGTSMRSGTLQYLHVSEHGKICAKYPEKALEIRLGALNAVASGCFVFLESTAEGDMGDFHDTYVEAEARIEQGLDKSKLDFEPYFFPWWKEPTYILDQKVAIPEKVEEYFKDLKNNHGIDLNDKQRWWYAKKKQTQKNKMMQEFPSYPEEAFSQPVEGAYFRDEMIEVAEDGRILDFPWDKRLPVNTFWDLGIRASDTTCIWFHQRIGIQDWFLDFYQHHGVGLDHYMKVLDDKGYRYGKHYVPHDIRVREIGNSAKRRETVLREGGIGELVVVERVEHKGEAIEMARQKFDNAVFHKTNCKDGTRALRAYRREYDDVLKAWRETPLHDWASNPTDAWMTFVQGYKPPNKSRPLHVQRRGISTI